MSRFRPVRASSPAKSSFAPKLNAHDLLSDSRSSTVSVPELVGLGQEDVDFIDAVIERAPASATTFLTVFKAYNDILQERGLDPQNEVVYYGKLLKLGTLKGANWGEKWNTIKQQQGYVAAGTHSGRRTTRIARNAPPVGAIKTRLTTGIPRAQPEDTLTLHSHPDDAGSVHLAPGAEARTELPGYGYDDTPRPGRRLFSPSITTETNSLGLHTGPPAWERQTRATPRITQTTRAVPSRPPAPWIDDASEFTDVDVGPPSTIPPSYGAATRDTTPWKMKHSATPRPQSKQAFNRASSSSPSPLQPTAPSSRLGDGKGRRTTIMNEDDAWSKVKEAQDIKEADRFREEKLLERCWDVWRQGYEWIITTHAQIAQARDQLILRLALQRWRQRTDAHHDLYVRVSALSDRRCLKLALQIWRANLKEKKQTMWRDSMRARMQIVRQRRETKLVKDAWAKWRQSYRSHLSELHFSERFVGRYFKRWKERLSRLDQMDAAADHFLYDREERTVERCWDLWRHAAELRKAEQCLSERVGLSIMGAAVNVWKKRLNETRAADEFYDVIVMKRTLRAWKAARERIRTLESRAAKYQARQDDVLTRAVLRVWKAHERGRLLERVRAVRLLKQASTTWRQHMQHMQDMQVLADAFSTRSSSSLTHSALRKWRDVYTTHKNAQSFAIHYHSAQLRYKILLAWRLQLRAKLKMAKQARLAQKFFLQRSCWKKWTTHLAQKKLDTKLKGFEAQLTRKLFHEWLEASRQQRQRNVAEEIIRQRIDMRLITESLTHWVNRVVDIKDREHAVDHRYQKKILTAAFKKWKALCIRHVEELSLMESYQDVKREENMRRMFYRWLTAARKARHRRLYLQEKEEEMKLTVIAAAWDKWREQFLDLRLQPIADDFIVQREKVAMFHAFATWHGKTRSLPAVRFDAYHTRLKAWRIWRAAMPRALQAKQAREMDQKSVLSQAFEKWQKAYKTKIELKAVARARYLRLPTSTPRQVLDHPRSTPASQASRNPFPSRAPRSVSPTNDAHATPVSAPAFARPFSGRSGIASLLLTKARSESPERLGKTWMDIGGVRTSASRPRLSTRASTTRATSPAPSDSLSPLETRRGAESIISAGEVGRGTLWQELRGMRIRPRPLSEHSKP